MEEIGIYEYVSNIGEMKLKMINTHFKKYDYFFYFKGYDFFLKTPDYDDYAVPIEYSVPADFSLNDFYELIEYFKEEGLYNDK